VNYLVNRTIIFQHLKVTEARKARKVSRVMDGKIKLQTS